MRDLLLFIVAMLTLLVLIRSANQPKQGKHYWQVSLQTLLSAIILASILFGIIAISTR
jgi:hypothetical protein